MAAVGSIQTGVIVAANEVARWHKACNPAGWAEQFGAILPDREDLASVSAHRGGLRARRPRVC